MTDQQLEQSRADQDSFTTRMRAFAATACDTSRDDEARYLAIMQITAAFWKRRQPRVVVTDRDPPATLAISPTKQENNLTPLAKPPGGTIREYAEQLILQAEGDGRGLPYDKIRELIVKRFPVVTLKGRWFGKPTTMTRKELHMVASDLNKRPGIVLPQRPRSQQQCQPKDLTTNCPTRQAAIAQGLPRYFTGKQCPRGHTAERYSASGRCVQCHRETANVKRPKHTVGRLCAVESADVILTRDCFQCGAPFRPASLDTERGERRPAMYCSAACKQAAYAARKALRDEVAA